VSRMGPPKKRSGEDRSSRDKDECAAKRPSRAASGSGGAGGAAKKARGAAAPGNADGMRERKVSMLQWIRDAGVQWKDADLEFRVEVGSSGSGGVLVCAKRDLAPHMGLARIPKSACLSVPNVEAVHSRLEQFDLEDDFDIALAAAITHEILLGAESKWHGYLSALSPEGESVPMLWSEEKLCMLEGTGMQEEVDQDRQRFAYFWTDHVRPLLEDALGAQKVPPAASFQAFLRAVSYSNSRGFYVDERHGEAMVPFADLFNHKTAYTPLEYEVWGLEDDSSNSERDLAHEFAIDEADADEECDVDDADQERIEGHEQTMCLASSQRDGERDELVVGLLRPVKKGAEVFNTYGEHGNRHLLANYGFTLKGNIFDEVGGTSVYVAFARSVCVYACSAGMHRCWSCCG